MQRTPRKAGIVILSIWLAVGIAVCRNGASARIESSGSCINCHSKLKDKAGEVVEIYQTSTHNSAGVSCEDCHGGDSSQSDKAKAHNVHFVARPDTNGTLAMCGQCHVQPLELFKTSRHVAARPSAPRLDCAECHGVHAIGAASDSLRWPQFCAGCHGLEYLPQLPRPFQEMVALADDLREGLHRLSKNGRTPSKELIVNRKEIRHMISLIVHQTDTKGGLEKVAHILELGAKAKQQIAAEEER